MLVMQMRGVEETFKIVETIALERRRLCHRVSVCMRKAYERISRRTLSCANENVDRRFARHMAHRSKRIHKSWQAAYSIVSSKSDTVKKCWVYSKEHPFSQNSKRNASQNSTQNIILATLWRIWYTMHSSVQHVLQPIRPPQTYFVERSHRLICGPNLQLVPICFEIPAFFIWTLHWMQISPCSTIPLRIALYIPFVLSTLSHAPSPPSASSGCLGVISLRSNSCFVRICWYGQVRHSRRERPSTAAVEGSPGGTLDTRSML